MMSEHQQIRPALCGFVATVLLASSQVAVGQTSNPGKRDKANAIAKEANTLRDAGKDVEACQKLEEAELLVPDGIGVHWALGECYERLQRLGSACHQYEESERYARIYDDLVRLEKAVVKRGETCQRAATLTILATKNHTQIGAILSIDGRSRSIIDGITWHRLDRGKHAIAVLAPNHKPWAITVDMSDGAKVYVYVPTLEPEVTRPQYPPAHVPFSRKNLGAILTFPSVVACGIAGVGRLTLDRSNSSNPTNDLTVMTAIDIGLIAAGVVGVTGTILLVSSNPSPSQTAQAQWQVGVNPTGFTLRADW